ncbi:MAG: hypothetical protein GY906_12785 [bacterium]|nr:hypothetical protein [bacterium]
MGTVYFEVVTSATGEAFQGTDRDKAEECFAYLCGESQSAYGEVCGEIVTLLSNGTPEESFTPIRIISLPGLDGVSINPNDSVMEFRKEEYISGNWRECEPSYWREVKPEDATYTGFSDYHNTVGDWEDYPIETLYILPSLLSGGDYSGQGMVGKANVKDFTEEFGEHFEALNIHELSGGFDSFGIAIPLTVLVSLECNLCGVQEMAWGDELAECEVCAAARNIRETLDGFENYCVINDETLTELEMEDWNEQWEDWGRNDFIGELSGFYPDQYEFDNVTDDSADDLFRKLCEASGTYPEMDGDSMYIRLSEVTSETTRADIEALDGIDKLPADSAEEWEEWQAERAEESSKALEGYSYVVCRKFDKGHYGTTDGDENKFPKLCYIAGSPSTVTWQTNREPGWSIRFIYRIEYTPAENNTPLMPGYELAETPEVK